MEREPKVLGWHPDVVTECLWTSHFSEPRFSYLCRVFVRPVGIICANHLSLSLEEDVEHKVVLAIPVVKPVVKAWRPSPADLLSPFSSERGLYLETTALTTQM